MGQRIIVTETDRNRIKGLYESNINQTMLQQETQKFNGAVGEDLTIEEYKELKCFSPDDIDSELPPTFDNDGKQKIMELKERMKRASFSELIQLKKQIKELKRQSKQQQNEQAYTGPLVTLLGISMPPAFAIGAYVFLFILALSFLQGLFHFGGGTDYCDGKKSRIFGLFRW
jgi:hypothetical protein